MHQKSLSASWSLSRAVRRRGWSSRNPSAPIGGYAFREEDPTGRSPMQSSSTRQLVHGLARARIPGDARPADSEGLNYVSRAHALPFAYMSAVQATRAVSSDHVRCNLARVAQRGRSAGALVCTAAATAAAVTREVIRTGAQIVRQPRITRPCVEDRLKISRPAFADDRLPDLLLGHERCTRQGNRAT
jgi:hypothetical protein